MQVNNTIQKINLAAKINFFTCILLTVAYVVSGKLGLMLALPPGYASPIFPPAGIALAAALISGRKSLPWIFLGSLLLNLWISYSSSHHINVMGLNVALIIAIASVLQAAIGGWGLRRIIGYPAAFDNSADIIRFLLLVPLICLTSATLSVSGLSALGIFELENYASNWASWWVGDTLGVLIMFPLMMIFIAEPFALWQSRRLTVAFPLLLILSLFVMIFLKVNQWENNDSLMEFRQLSQQTVNQLQNKLGEQETVLDEVAALFAHDAQGRVTRDEFHRFAQKSLQRFSMIQALEWAVPVEAADRASFVAAQRKRIPGFEIRERDANGELQRAADRAAFFPVTYVEPLLGNEAAAGFDLASNPARLAALTAATQKNVLIATHAIHLVQDSRQQTGILLLLAVNSNSNKSGLVLIALRMSEFMEKLLLGTRPMIYTRFIDLDDQKTLYDNFTPDSPSALYEHTFSFGTRQYRLETAPTPAYFMQHHGWQSWSVLAAGILGTGLLGALLLLGTGYTVRITAQVEDRTRKLKESESRFRNILRNAPIGMATTDLHGQFIQINHAICAILGDEKDELEKLTLKDITHPDDVPQSLAYRHQLLHGKINSYRMEKRYLRKDGQVVWTLLAESIERDDVGTPLYFISQIEDISERKQVEQSLREAEARFRSSFEAAAIGMALVSIEGGFVDVNPALCQIVGYSHDELTRKTFQEITHPDDLELDLDYAQELILGKRASYQL